MSLSHTREQGPPVRQSKHVTSPQGAVASLPRTAQLKGTRTQTHVTEIKELVLFVFSCVAFDLPTGGNTLKYGNTLKCTTCSVSLTYLKVI